MEKCNPNARKMWKMAYTICNNNIPSDALKWLIFNFSFWIYKDINGKKQQILKKPEAVTVRINLLIASAQLLLLSLFFRDLDKGGKNRTMCTVNSSKQTQFDALQQSDVPQCVAILKLNLGNIFFEAGKEKKISVCLFAPLATLLRFILQPEKWSSVVSEGKRSQPRLNCWTCESVWRIMQTAIAGVNHDTCSAVCVCVRVLV